MFHNCNRNNTELILLEPFGIIIVVQTLIEQVEIFLQKTAVYCKSPAMYIYEYFVIKFFSSRRTLRPRAAFYINKIITELGLYS
jgi:hypothetical protein